TEKAFSHAGRASYGDHPRGYAGALSRTLWHHTRRSSVRGTSRCWSRSDDLSLEPAAGAPSAATRLCCRTDTKERCTDQLHRGHRTLRVDGSRLQHFLHFPWRRGGMDLCSSAALLVSLDGDD